MLNVYELLRATTAIIAILLLAACPPISTLPPTPQIRVETIPLSVTPNIDILNNNQTIIVAVAPEEWKNAKLMWTISSTNLESAGELSSNVDHAIVYRAPIRGQGDVTISVSGSTNSSIGTASVTFQIVPSLGYTTDQSLVAIFPSIGVYLYENPSFTSSQIVRVQELSKLPVRDCFVNSGSNAFSCSDLESFSQTKPQDIFWIRVELPDGKSGWLDGRLVRYEGNVQLLPPPFRIYSIINRDDLPFVKGKVENDGGEFGNNLIFNPRLNIGEKSNQLAVIPNHIDVTLLYVENDWYYVLLVLPSHEPPILRGWLPKVRVSESTE